MGLSKGLDDTWDTTYGLKYYSRGRRGDTIRFVLFNSDGLVAVNSIVQHVDFCAVNSSVQWRCETRLYSLRNKDPVIVKMLADC